MDKAYQITLYEFSSYGYSGIEEQENFFPTEEKALDFAEKQGYKICEYVENPRKECTINVVKVRSLRKYKP